MNRIPWLALAIAGLAGALALGAWAVDAWSLPLPACPLKAHTGIPCATCGITRCVQALAEGRWTLAFHWHPVAAALAVLSPLAAAWDLRRAWRGDAYPGLPDSLAWRLGAAGLLAGTWILQIVRKI